MEDPTTTKIAALAETKMAGKGVPGTPVKKTKKGPEVSNRAVKVLGEDA